MHALTFQSPRILPTGRRGRALLALALGLVSALLADTAGAVDLTDLANLGGPLATALTQLANLETGIKALIGFLGFLIAFIALAALKNMGPVLFYVGLVIFGAVGLPIGAAILGAVI